MHSFFDKSGKKVKRMTRCRKRIPKVYWFIELVGMICGMVWTYWVLGVLIDCLTAIGVVTKLSATFLALSVIAIGNALPDAIVTVSLAKKGKA